LTYRTLYRLLVTFAEGIASPRTITAEEVERLKSSDALASILAEFSEAFPEVRRTLIDERDQYLAEKIASAPGNTVVAIIGAGHTPGIKRWFGTATDLSALNTLPTKSLARRLLGWGIPLLIATLLVSGFLHSGGETGAKMATTWLIVTAVATGIGAALALAHPITILVSMLVSPFTTLNPFLRAGWIAALVEALLRRPRVSDMETVADDMFSLRSWYRNRVRRILLVLVLVNLFGLLGSLVGVTVLATYF
jgi:pheromone shutdown-related protein TraB